MEADSLGLVRDDTRARSCVCLPQLADRSADLLGEVLPQVRERQNVAWLACAYGQVSFLLDCCVPDGRGLWVSAGIGRRVDQ